jgi:hypothetical protein
MKLHKTATHDTPKLNPIASTASKSTNETTGSEPLYDDIYVQPNTMLRAKNRGFGEHFVHMVKKIALLALNGFRPGDRVDSKMLCAEIRYGLYNDKPVDNADVPGLDKGERQLAGRVIWLLADAGELPLESLGRNTANLQQYRLM